MVGHGSKRPRKALMGNVFETANSPTSSRDSWCFTPGHFLFFFVAHQSKSILLRNLENHVRFINPPQLREKFLAPWELCGLTKKLEMYCRLWFSISIFRQQKTSLTSLTWFVGLDTANLCWKSWIRKEKGEFNFLFSRLKGLCSLRPLPCLNKERWLPIKWLENF